MPDDKRIISTQILEDTADAIREKLGTQAGITPAEFASKISEISPAPDLQSKTVDPTTSQQVVSADSGYYGLSTVTVNAVDPSQYQKTEISVNITPSTSSQTITPSSSNEVFNVVNISAVTSSIDEYIVPENIKKNINILGVTGTYEGSGGGGGAASLLNKTITEFNDVNEEVPFLDSYAFANCSLLSTVNFPVVSYIGTSAFLSCSSLVEMSFPECTRVGLGAFYDCSNTNLISVNFPQCSMILASAFYQCRSLRTISFPKCEQIGISAFTGCDFLSSLNLPRCLSIDNNAFRFCERLSSIELPHCLKIGQYAFSSCWSLHGISLPSCMSLNTGAFMDCSQLSYIKLDNFYTTIGSSAFANCGNKLSVPFDIDLSCVTIGEGAFQSAAISSANFPYCAYIESLAFFNASINHISIPACSVIQINGFRKCSKLTSIWLENIETIGSYAFSECESLESVYVLGNNWLNQVPTLSSAVFRSTPLDNTSYLGHYGSIYVRSEFVTSFKSSWTDYSNRITAIDSSYNSYYVYATEYASSDISYVPMSKSSVHKILRNAFFRCSNLKSISFPDCEMVMQWAFTSCTNLSNIYLPQCIYIGANAFENCNNVNLVSIDLPCCTYIDNSAFKNAYNLSYINIPQVKCVANYAFTGCTRLQEINLSECVHIKSYAFSNCYSISNVSIPKCLSIGSWAFAYNSALTTISLNCMYIGGSAFNNCTKLSAVYLLNEAGICSIDYATFSSTPIATSSYLGYFGSIYVPSSLYSAYIQAGGYWAYYRNRFVSV